MWRRLTGSSEPAPHPTPPSLPPHSPSLPYHRQRVLMAVLLCLLPKRIKRQPPWARNAGGGVLLSPQRSHGWREAGATGLTPDSSTHCVVCVPAVSHISGRGCNSPEISGAIILPSKLSLQALWRRVDQTCPSRVSISPRTIHPQTAVTHAHKACGINLNISALLLIFHAGVSGDVRIHTWAPLKGPSGKSKKLFCPLVMGVEGVFSAPGTVSESGNRQFNQFPGELFHFQMHSIPELLRTSKNKSGI